MLGLVLLDVMGFIASLPQSSYYPDRSRYGYSDYYRDGDGWSGDGRRGTYRTFGTLARDDGYGIQDRRDNYGRYDDNFGYGRSDRGEMCPYDNIDSQTRSITKREIQNTDTDKDLLIQEPNKTESATDAWKKLTLKLKSSKEFSRLLQKYSRKKRHTAYARDGSDLYRDAGFYDRDDHYNGARARDDRYSDDRYYDRYDARYRDSGYGYGNRYDDRSRYGCKEACFWEAELECDTNKMEGAGRSNYRGRSNVRVKWTRDHDAYYPRDKYPQLLDYFRDRASLPDTDRDGTTLVDRDGISRLLIKRVKMEDKGVYRCYMDPTSERDFLEIPFFPQYPDDSQKC